MRNQSELPSLAAIKTPISEEAFDQLFREARTHSTWLAEGSCEVFSKPLGVGESLIRNSEAYSVEPPIDFVSCSI